MANQFVPPEFYRVQSSRSYTTCTLDGDFDSNDHFSIDDSYWINREGIAKHLNWWNREPTAFISVLDDLYAAQRRAAFLWDRQHQDWIARISIASLVKGSRPIYFSNETVHLPVLFDDQTTFFRVTDADGFFGLDCPVDPKEWLALDYILSDMTVLVSPRN